LAPCAAAAQNAPMRNLHGTTLTLTMTCIALVGCAETWTKPDARAFAEANSRCSRETTKAVPIEGKARELAYQDCMARSGTGP
jgi:hypothetical protein